MSNITLFTLETAQHLYNSQELISLDWAWQILGYSRKDNAKKALTTYFEPKFDYFVQRENKSIEPLSDGIYLNQEENSNAGRPSETVYLTVECFKQLGMLSRSEQGKKIRKYFLECEKIAKENFKQSQTIKRQRKPKALLQPSKEVIEHYENILQVEKEFGDYRSVDKIQNNLDIYLKQFKKL